MYSELIDLRFHNQIEMESRMYEQQQQHLIDLQEDNSAFGDDISSTLSSLSAAAAAASATGNVDRVLYTDLCEMIPLVQSLIDQKPKSSFNRRGSMVYTKTPSKESLYKKAAKKSYTLPAKKHGDTVDKNASNNQDGSVDNLSNLSSSLLSEKDREELAALRDQVADLKRQLEAKDELLKSAELSKNEMASICAEFDQLKNEALEKDELIRSSQLQLSDVKIKLADKQADMEKLQWEAMTSNKKAEMLQEDLDTVQREISSFMLLIKGLTRNDYVISAGDGGYDDASYPLNENHELDYEMDMQDLEAAREAYITAVAAAKEKQDEGSIAAAATARFHLHSILLQ